MAASFVFAACVPFFRTPFFNNISRIACVAFIFALFTIMLAKYRSVRIEEVSMTFVFSLIIPLSLSCLVFVRNECEAPLGLFYVLIILGVAWISDAGAYFVGRFFGKHKLAPHISPKKTMEGAIGGIAIGIGGALLVGVIYAYVMQKLQTPVEMHYIRLAIVAFFGTILGMLGDLSFSLIKRQCDLKDFGSIMPGHGGVVDRFDSVLFVAPFVYVVLRYIPLAQLI